MSCNLHNIQSLVRGEWGPRFSEPERLPIDALVAWDEDEKAWVWWIDGTFGESPTEAAAKRTAEERLARRKEQEAALKWVKEALR